MLSLGHILISDLVVTNLLVYSLPGMILLYLAALFLHQRCFSMRYSYTVITKEIYRCCIAHLEWRIGAYYELFCVDAVRLVFSGPVTYQMHIYTYTATSYIS